MLLFLVWTSMALLFVSPFIGFFAVGALLAALGWNDFALWVINGLGAQVRSRFSHQIEHAALAGFVIMALFVSIRLLSGILTVFALGSVILGSVSSGK